MPVLLDSNILIYYLQDQQPYADAVEQWIQQGTVAISVISIAEYLSKPPLEGTAPLEKTLSIVDVVPVTIEIAKTAGELRHRLIRKRTRVALIDCLIAATAITRDYQIATADRKGFPFKELKFAKFK
ncbi:MAG: PIN domain-containing protein [Patescibacteria group bacterium]